MRAHGTHACYVFGPATGAGTGCRCDACRAAHAVYEKNRSARVEPPYVDAVSAREHIAWLAEHGVGLKQVSRVSGVSHGALWKLVSGKVGRGPSKRIRPATRDAILAVRPDEGADGSRIPAAATWKVIDELLERGWTRVAIARGIGQHGAGLQVSRRTVTRGTARTIAALLEQPVPPRRSRHGLRPVPQPITLDPVERLRIEAGRERAREARARYRAVERAAVDVAPSDVDEGDVYQLPVLTAPPGEWMHRAACRRPEVPTWLFFPDSDPITEQRAKDVCATCGVADACLAAALATGETGVWGGTTDGDRAQLTRSVS